MVQSSTPHHAHRLFAALFALLVWLSPGGIVEGQSVPDDEAVSQPAPTIQMVQRLVNQQKFVEAQVMCERLIEANVTNARAWFFLGYTRHAAGDLDRAMVADLMAVELGGPMKPVAMYNIACVYSLKNNVPRSYHWLDRAIKAGFSDSTTMRNDSDLVNIREDERWEAYLRRVPATTRGGVPGPVVDVDESRNVTEADQRAAEEAAALSAEKGPIDWSQRPTRRQFDFWVGAWNAVDANGRVVGTNTITRREKGSIIHESWTGGEGTTGQSINYYDPGIGKWRQAWVSQGGGVVHYVGEFRDGAMRYEGEHITADGQTVTLARCILTPLDDGRIHHHIDHSTDGGETWKQYFDAHYVKRTGG